MLCAHGSVAESRETPGRVNLMLGDGAHGQLRKWNQDKHTYTRTHTRPRPHADSPIHPPTYTRLRSPPSYPSTHPPT